jgi:ATP-dependent 26S proteasome regulatory subunit
MVLESAPDWETEVGGLHEQKMQIEEIFHISQRFALFFKGQKLSQGLLLYGPPGCGKTYMAAAIAKRF